MELAYFVEGDDESLYCHGNLIITLFMRGMISDYVHQH